MVVAIIAILFMVIIKQARKLGTQKKEMIKRHNLAYNYKSMEAEDRLERNDIAIY